MQVIIRNCEYRLH